MTYWFIALIGLLVLAANGIAVPLAAVVALFVWCAYVVGSAYIQASMLREVTRRRGE